VNSPTDDRYRGHTDASDPAGPATSQDAPVTLSVKKILAGRGAVNYYLEQTRRGLADYYLGERSSTDADGAAAPPLAAPGASWWGGGAETLELDGPVERAQFVPLYAKGVRPDGGYLGRRFRTQEDVAATRAERLAATEQLADPYERWQARQRLARSGPQASVAAWDATFSPVKSVSLLWAAGDRHIQRQVWAAHCAAVDAGLGYLEEHAGFVRAGRNGIRVLDSDGLVVARMNEWTSRDGDMQLHTHCLILNRARTTTDGKWRALDGRALLAAKTGAAAIYHRVLEAELTRRLQVGWRDRPEGLRELDGVPDELIVAFSTRRRAITAEVDRLAAAYQDRYGTSPPAAVRHRMAQDATLATQRPLTKRSTRGRVGRDSTAPIWQRCPHRWSAETARRTACRRPGMSSVCCSAGSPARTGRRSPATICCVPPSTSSRSPTGRRRSCAVTRSGSSPGCWTPTWSWRCTPQIRSRSQTRTDVLTAPRCSPGTPGNGGRCTPPSTAKRGCCRSPPNPPAQRSTRQRSGRPCDSIGSGPIRPQLSPNCSMMAGGSGCSSARPGRARPARCGLWSTPGSTTAATCSG
jgi:conjugative relaxase-like TrwC/TraI family protein